jgi:hypothetical protein
MDLYLTRLLTFSLAARLAQLQFRTTCEYQKRVDDQYKSQIDKMQAQIDEEGRRRKQIMKFTAKAFVSKPPVIFWVRGDSVYCDEISESRANLCRKYTGGRVFNLDPAFSEQVQAFQERPGL